jgi:rod shape-determining protein MreD
MDNLATSRVWMMRAGFVGLALVIMFFHLLPLDTVPRRWAPPDLLVAFVFAWTLRRPDYVPVLLIAAVMLLADLMLQRPPGLLALLVVLGSEYLKNRAANLSDSGFIGEWATICLVLLVIVVLNRLLLGLVAVQQAPMGLSISQLVMTMMTYPIVALVTQTFMRVRRPSPGDSDAMGARG